MSIIQKVITAARRSTLAVAIPLAACGSDNPTTVDPKGNGAPTSLVVVSGRDQAATVGQELAQPLVVKVLDSGGKPVRGVTVGWAVTAGGGALNDVTTSTTEQGLAQVRWTLGATAGGQTVSVSATGLSAVSFAARLV